MVSCFIKPTQNLRDIFLAPALLFSSSAASLLLQRLEDIFTRTSQGAGADYLSVLTRVIKSKSEREALDQLKTVRIALARYFARSLVSRGARA